MIEMQRNTLTGTKKRIVSALKAAGPAHGIHALANRISDGAPVGVSELSSCLSALKQLESSGRVKVQKGSGTFAIVLKQPNSKLRTIAMTAMGSALVLAGCASVQDLPQYGPQPLPTYQPAQYHKPQDRGDYWSYCENWECPRPTAKTLKVDAPPPPRKKETMSLSADVLFDFDSAKLKPKGREVLEAMGSKLRDRNNIEVQVLGYTDRLGGDLYNQKLSQRRADVVRVFLSTYVGGSKIEAIGRGKNNPLTAGACNKPMPVAKLRECLQPDRRVEINVTQGD